MKKGGINFIQRILLLSFDIFLHSLFTTSRMSYHIQIFTFIQRLYALTRYIHGNSRANTHC